MKEKSSVTLELYDVGSLGLAKNMELLSQTMNTKISTDIYGIPKKYVDLVGKYWDGNSYRDAIGKFVEWLIMKIDMYEYPY